MNTQEAIFFALTSSLLAVSGWRYWQQQPRQAVLALMAAALTLRLGVAGLDPFLHNWDERYHALVAKNMLADWMQPMLRADPVLAYDYRQWCCNAIWLHKQPLFLWQIAASFRLFGVSELALRLPSAVLGALVIWPVYRIGCLIFSPLVGYCAGVLLALACYSLELTSGWQSVDHADVAFLTYLTASLWAYYESQEVDAEQWRWALLTGLLAGAAVLCKWLPGLVVFAAWGCDLLASPSRRVRAGEYGRLLAAASVALVVVLPWQFYIRQHFPLESAFEQNYAARHFNEVLEDKGGPWYFYFTNLWYQFQWLTLLIGAGLVLLFSRSVKSRPLLPLLVVCGAVFGFFSLAATKMVSYTYVLAPCLLLLAALAWVSATQWLTGRGPVGKTAGLLLGILIIVLDLRPTALLKHHSLAHTSDALRRERQQKLQHTAVYRRLDAMVPAGYLVLNAPALEDVEAMFYSHRNVYAWWPPETEYRALRQRGVGVAVFAEPGSPSLPAYLREPAVLVIPAALQ